MQKIKIALFSIFTFLVIPSTYFMEAPTDSSYKTPPSYPKPHFPTYLHTVPLYLYTTEIENHTDKECKDYAEALKVIEIMRNRWKIDSADEEHYIDKQKVALTVIYLMMQGYSKEVKLLLDSLPIPRDNLDKICLETILATTLEMLVEQELITKQQIILKKINNSRQGNPNFNKVIDALNEFSLKDELKMEFPSTAHPQEVMPLLTQAFKTLQSMLKNGENAIKCAVYIHNQIVTIHGFKTGNGRLARLMLNFMLMRYGYSPIKISNTSDYRQAFRKGDQAFAEFIIEKLKEVEIACHWCGKNAKNESTRCSRCKSGRYCSQECQRTAWNNGHKNVCKANKG